MRSLNVLKQEVSEFSEVMIAYLITDILYKNDILVENNIKPLCHRNFVRKM